MSDNKWFVVHLTDLLYHCGQLKLSADESEKSEQFRESLIYDFGLTLMSKGSMWQIGLDYLKYSCTEGLGARELLIARVPIKNEKCAMKIIAYAKKNEFTSVGK
jgi:nuclear pore complex protein Nup85